MPVLALVYPSPALARLADPLRLAATEPGADPTEARLVLGQARQSIRDALEPLVQDRTGPADPRWYWAAPLLLDDRAASDGIDWLQRWDATYAWTGLHRRLRELSAHRSCRRGSRDRHRRKRRRSLGLGNPPEDLDEVLALLALAGPGNCALRALSRGNDNWLDDRPRARLGRPRRLGPTFPLQPSRGDTPRSLEHRALLAARPRVLVRWLPSSRTRRVRTRTRWNGSASPTERIP